MSQKLTAGLPEALDLSDGWVIRFAALDPTTGAAVSGVNVSGASIIATNMTDHADELLASGPFMLVPGPEA